MSRTRLHLGAALFALSLSSCVSHGQSYQGADREPLPLPTDNQPVESSDAPAPDIIFDNGPLGVPPADPDQPRKQREMETRLAEAILAVALIEDAKAARRAEERRLAAEARAAKGIPDNAFEVDNHRALERHLRARSWDEVSWEDKDGAWLIELWDLSSSRRENRVVYCELPADASDAERYEIEADLKAAKRQAESKTDRWGGRYHRRYGNGY